MLELSMNLSLDYFPYPKDMVSTQNVINGIINTKKLRWFGGTASKLYRFRDNFSFFNAVDIEKRNATYGNYKMWNFTNNPIWPYIKTVTNDLTQDSSCTFVLPMLSHYTTTNGLRAELLTKYLKLAQIKDMASLDASAMSSYFKAEVRDGIDTIKCLLANRVSITGIEYLNEGYMDFCETGFKNNLNRKVWSRHPNESDFSLNVFKELCAMYGRIIRTIIPNAILKMPMAEELLGGHKLWNLYLLRKDVMDYIGYDEIVLHPYSKNVNLTGLTIDKYYINEFLKQRSNFYLSVDLEWKPKLNGRGISFSEISISEYYPSIRGTMLEAILFMDEVDWMNMHGINSAHWHAFSNGMHAGCALKMNGATKPNQIVLNGIGLAYNLWNDHNRPVDFINPTSSPIPINGFRNMDIIQATSLSGVPIRKEIYSNVIEPFSTGYYSP